MGQSSRISRFLPLGIFLAIIVFLAIGLTKDPRALPSRLIDRPLPKFELSQLGADADPISNEELKGRVTVMNVFGSWCQACLVEHPTLLRLGELSSFDLVGVNWRDKRVDAIRWLNRFGDPYDYILFDGDSDLAIELGVTGAPETFIVDAAGQIRFKHTGPITDNVYADKIAPIIAALNSEMNQ